MTFRRRRWFMRRLALALAFAAAFVPRAAAMPGAAETGAASAPALEASAPSGGGGDALWNDIAYALGGAAAAIGLGATVTALRTLRDSRLARA